MKIVIATGASGGHIFPALKVKKALEDRGHEVLTHGLSVCKIDSLKKSEAVFDGINPGYLEGKTFLKSICSLGAIFYAAIKARRILIDEKPDVVLGFGSYLSFPVVFAATTLKIPTLIHEQNVVMGKANKFLSRFVDKIAVSFEETLEFVDREKSFVSGCPCHCKDVDLSKETILKEFGLSPDKKTILVLGGSQGSEKINNIFFDCLKELIDKDRYQAVHMTGMGDFSKFQKKYYDNRIVVSLFDFLTDIEKAYTVADIVVSRAGAATVSELKTFNINSILIPYPHAKGHQELNAKVLCDKGQAVLIKESDLTAEFRFEKIVECFKLPKKQKEGLNFLPEDKIVTCIEGALKWKK